MIDTRIEKIKVRIDICWKMSWVFLENKDAHGIHDMGVCLLYTSPSPRD